VYVRGFGPRWMVCVSTRCDPRLPGATLLTVFAINRVPPTKRVTFRRRRGRDDGRSGWLVSVRSSAAAAGMLAVG